MYDSVDREQENVATSNSEEQQQQVLVESAAD